MNHINVLLADDHPIFLKGIREILTKDPSIHIVAETHCATQLLSIVEKFRPDLVICDASMPPTDMRAVIQTLKMQWPETRTLIISEIDEEEKILEFLSLGIDGYMLKKDNPDLLFLAVKEVMAGGVWLSPRLIKQLLGCLFTPFAISITGKMASKLLSRREREVLKLVATGLENDKIADRLCITKRTVQNHVSIIYKKLNITSRSHLFFYALQQGILSH